DPARLLPDLDAQARVMIAAPGGQVLFSSPALHRAGARAEQQVHAAATTAADGALLRDGEGKTWATASANVAIGNFRVMPAAPTDGDIALWFGALARFAIVAAAPLAAIGVLYLLTRQNALRAEIAEAEVVRAETHFRLAADGARAGVLEWRADIDQVQL